MRRPLHLLGTIALATAAQVACSTTPVNFGPEPGIDHDASRSREISASACGFNISDLIPIMTQSLYARAYERLRQQAPHDYITDVQIQIYWRYAVVGLSHCAILTANAHPKSAATR